jgi:hypothetical protein
MPPDWRLFHVRRNSAKRLFFLRRPNLGRRGKSGEGKFLRVYDKGVQSAGKIEATRVEPELIRWNDQASMPL